MKIRDLNRQFEEYRNLLNERAADQFGFQNMISELKKFRIWNKKQLDGKVFDELYYMKEQE